MDIGFVVSVAARYKKYPFGQSYGVISQSGGRKPLSFWKKRPFPKKSKKQVDNGIMKWYDSQALLREGSGGREA